MSTIPAIDTQPWTTAQGFCRILETRNTPLPFRAQVRRSMLGQGVYNLPEAARLTRLPISRVREWFRGRSPNRDSPPVFLGDYPVIDGAKAISFHDLVELFVSGQLREIGLSLQILRKVHNHLQEKWGVSHPFCRREIRLSRDGKQVFTCGLDAKEKGQVIEVLTNQKVFPEIILPVLKKINYDKATKLALRWHLTDMVVIDPAIRFGKPIVAPAGKSTAILSQAFSVNGEDAEIVGDWYGVRPEHVMAAVHFERGLTSTRAAYSSAASRPSARRKIC